MFACLAEKYIDTLFRVAFNYLRSKADAEDVAQNVFLKLFKAKVLWQKPDEEIRKWIVTVALNECRDMKRKLFRRNHADIDELQVTYTEDFNKELIREIRNLPLKYLQVIVLYYFEGYSISEISDILSEKENTIKSRLKRGRELLKGGLRDE